MGRETDKWQTPQVGIPKREPGAESLVVARKEL